MNYYFYKCGYAHKKLPLDLRLYILVASVLGKNISHIPSVLLFEMYVLCVVFKPPQANTDIISESRTGFILISVSWDFRPGVFWWKGVTGADVFRVWGWINTLPRAGKSNHKRMHGNNLLMVHGHIFLAFEHNTSILSQLLLYCCNGPFTFNTMHYYGMGCICMKLANT